MWFVFSVFDRAAQEYGQLYLARNMQVGARMFSDAVCGAPETILRLHPEDYDLHQLGLFDEVTGQLVAGEVETVITAVEALRRQNGGPDGSKLQE